MKEEVVCKFIAPYGEPRTIRNANSVSMTVQFGEQGGTQFMITLEPYQEVTIISGPGSQEIDYRILGDNGPYIRPLQ